MTAALTVSHLKYVRYTVSLVHPCEVIFLIISKGANCQQNCCSGWFKKLTLLDLIHLCMQAPTNAVIALPPTTMEIVDLNSDIKDHLRDVKIGLQEQQAGQGIEHIGLFDDEDLHATFVSYARKYQPNSEIRTHTPPKLPIKMVQVCSRSCCTHNQPQTLKQLSLLAIRGSLHLQTSHSLRK